MADDVGRWDFFVSYAQADRAWASWVAWQIEAAGYRVLLQDWDFVGGVNWINKIQDGVTHTDRTVAVLSASYLESKYASAEWQAAWGADPLGVNRKLLVVRVADCQRPGVLAGVVGVDVFGVHEATARTRLLELIEGAQTGRARPGQSPGFPEGKTPTERKFPGTPMPVFNIPRRNMRFTGRVAELRSLQFALNQVGTVTVHSVHGMGGIGKTQLALEFAHSRANDYAVVWWVACEQVPLIPNQFAQLGERLGVHPPNDPEAIRSVVHRALGNTTGWLLILDNVDAISDIDAWIPSQPQASHIPGHVIITTRRVGFSALGGVLDLDVLQPRDAVELLRSRPPEADDGVLAELATELGYLPLALEQAAAYTEKAGMPPEEYLELFRGRSVDLYGLGRAGSHPETIATLWDLSLQRLARTSPASVQLLELCAFMAAEPIPLDLFTKHVDALPQPLANAAADPLAFAEVLIPILDYSLAKRAGNAIQLHRLTQDVIRSRADTPHSSFWGSAGNSSSEAGLR